MPSQDRPPLEEWQEKLLESFEKMERPLTNIVCVILGNPFSESDVSDVLQQVSLAVIQCSKAPNCNEKWLKQITRNKAKDCLGMRARYRDRFQSTSPDLDQVSDNDINWLEIEIRRESAQLLTQELKELIHSQRLVLVMHFYECLSYEEIAEITKIPAATVRSHAWRGLRILRDQLEKKYADFH
jgi:RNA polymerase sigma-70 factor, ECF subfamily